MGIFGSRKGWLLMLGCLLALIFPALSAAQEANVQGVVIRQEDYPQVWAYLESRTATDAPTLMELVDALPLEACSRAVSAEELQGQWVAAPEVNGRFCQVMAESAGKNPEDIAGVLTNMPSVITVNAQGGLRYSFGVTAAALDGAFEQVDGVYGVRTEGFEVLFLLDTLCMRIPYTQQGETAWVELFHVRAGVEGEQDTQLGQASPEQAETLVFGSYEQDGDLWNGREPLEWVVAARREDGTALLISRSILAVMPKEDARAWLSGDFVDLAFSTREKETLLTEHPMSSLKRGACFLLTGEEAAAYLDADALVAAGSVHAGTEEGRWWLNDADQPLTQCYVDEQGAIRLDGFIDMDWNGSHPSAGVRPACWADLSLVGEETAALPEFALPYAQPGQLVTFGHYEQNNVTMDGAEPIEWLVLASRNGESLLLSRYVLAQQAMGSSAWADSPLRRWLGGAFRESAFTQEERGAIRTMLVANPCLEKVDADDTAETVFLLSQEEVERYLPGAEERLTMRTAAMVAQGTNGWIPQERSVAWLTRTMGSFSTLCTVSDSGDWLIRRHDQAYGNDNQFLNGIRPAIWLDLSLLMEDMVDASGRNQGEDSEAMALDALKEAAATALDSWAGDDKVTSSQPLLSAAGAEQNAERWRRTLMEQLLTAAKDWVSEDVFDHFAKDGLLRAWDDYCEANMPSADGWSIWDAVAEDPVGVLVEPLRQLSLGPWDEAEELRAPQDMTAAAARIDPADIARDVWRRTQANLNEDGVTFVQYISQCAGKRLVNALMSATQLTGTEMAPSGLTADGAESLPLFAQYATCYILTLAMDALYTDFSRMPYLSETEQRQLGSQYTSLRSGIVELQTAVMTDDLQADQLTACANDALLALYNTQEIAQRHPLDGLWKDIFAQWTAKLTDRGWSFDAAGQILQTAVKDGKVGQSLLNQLLNRDALKRAFQEENQKLEDGAEDALSLPEMDALAQRWQDAERVVNDPTVQALWKVTGEIWEVGEELVVMTNQWENALEGEDKVSMMVARLLPAYWNSQALEITLVQATGAQDRTAALALGHTVEAFDTGSANMRIWMNAQEILDPRATPELRHIKRLTDMILLQMHEDQAGMGAYLTLVSQRDAYRSTAFYQHYLNDGVLLTEEEAVAQYNEIDRLIRWAEDSYDPAWDALF